MPGRPGVNRAARGLRPRKEAEMTIRRPTSRAWVAGCGLVLSFVAPSLARGQGTDWLLHPEHPCVQDPVTLYVRAFGSTPCDSFIFAGRVGERQVLIRTLVHEGIYCFAAPTPYAIPIGFDPMP